MARNGNAGAFETIVDRYQGRLLGFCRQMLGSTEDAEDVLQEVFVNAYRAMLADDREINLRPWLYRIARNRCLNHLRKPTADAQESMDMVPMVDEASTAEKVHNREEFRQLLTDVGKLPETQRSALMLREMDAMSYEEIASTMETSVPSVKSLLVRARISLAEASQARQLTCGEVRIELAEAAEGLRKVSGPARRHVRECDGCTDFRAQIRSNDKVLAALVPGGPLLALKGFILSKLGFGGASASSAGTSAAGAGAGTAATASGAGAVGSAAAAIGSSSAAGGLGAVGGAIGAKAVAGVVTAAVITAGAVEVKEQVSEPTPVVKSASVSTARLAPPTSPTPTHRTKPQPQPQAAEASPPEPTAAQAPDAKAAPDAEAEGTTDLAGPSATGESDDSATSPTGSTGVTAAKPPASAAGAPSDAGTVVVAVGASPATPAPSESAPPPSPPPEASEPPAEATPPPTSRPSGPTSESPERPQPPGGPVGS
jgi:RNA polymerase sigma factor (sigma-70 family)